MDYEQKYKEALERARELKNKLEKSCSLETARGIESIFPELQLCDDKRISKELICHINNAWICGGFTANIKRAKIDEWIAWLKKQGEQKPDWSEYDKVVIDAIYNTLKHGNVTKCGVEVTVMLLWLEELEKQGKRNNIVEQLTAFAQHLNKRGAFRDDLCMDFEHEAQSFIEFREYQNNKEL